VHPIVIRIGEITTKQTFGSLAPCCHCDKEAGFLRKLNDFPKTLNAMIQGMTQTYGSLILKMVEPTVRDLRAVTKCVEKKIRNKCSTSEKDALVTQGVVADAGRQTEQLDDTSVEESDAELNDAMTVFRRMDEFLEWGGGATC